MVCGPVFSGSSVVWNVESAGLSEMPLGCLKCRVDSPHGVVISGVCLAV